MNTEQARRALAQAIELIGGPNSDFKRAEQVLATCGDIENGELQIICGALLQFLILAQAWLAPDVVAAGLNRCRAMLATIDD